MSELITKLGIDYKLLIAQIVNFLVLLFILYKFAYGPILAMLEKRQKKIEQGLKDAEAAGKKLAESEERQKEILRKARTEAKEIVEKAHMQAEKSKSKIAGVAKVQAEKIITDAKAEIEREKTKTISEIKSEIGSLVVAATEKVIGGKMDEEKDKELIEKSLKS
ncbi:MAG: F0F1 ATP synthase subunit B [Patescibacteria group bacterium]|nr:F0F1 ATP synthase subunit B [Patescibacteria group bacterium]